MTEDNDFHFRNHGIIDCGKQQSINFDDDKKTWPLSKKYFLYGMLHEQNYAFHFNPEELENFPFFLNSVLYRWITQWQGYIKNNFDSQYSFHKNIPNDIAILPKKFHLYFNIKQELECAALVHSEIYRFSVINPVINSEFIKKLNTHIQKGETASFELSSEILDTITEKLKKVCGDYCIPIFELAADKTFQEDILFMFIKRALIPDETYQAIGQGGLKSKEGDCLQQRWIHHKCALTITIQQALLQWPRCQTYLQEKPQVIDRIIEEFVSYNNQYKSVKNEPLKINIEKVREIFETQFKEPLLASVKTCG